MRKIFFIGFIFSTMSINGQDYDREIESLAKDFEDQVIEWRHWFHANAELSNREFKTSAKIAEILNKRSKENSYFKFKSVIFSTKVDREELIEESIDSIKKDSTIIKKELEKKNIEYW